jgi:hypothetical protein
MTGRAGRDGIILWILREEKVGCEKAKLLCAGGLATDGFPDFLSGAS